MVVTLVFSGVKLTDHGERGIEITRRTMNGGRATHTIVSPYSMIQIADYLRGRMEREPQGLIQDIFPDMKAEDREFLMTGITPAQWNEMFGGEDD